MNLVTTHPFAAEELMAFCDGELSTEETQVAEAHLAGCWECADKVRHFRETSQSVRVWNAPLVSKRIEEAVEEQLQTADSGRGGWGSKGRFGRARRPRWRPWAIGGASAVAALLLIAVIGTSAAHYLLQAGSAPNPPTSTSVEELATGVPSRASAGAPQPSPPPDTASGTQTAAPLIARSVSMVVVAKDVAAARPTLDAILARYHGYASEMDVNTPADDAPSLKASLRIPVPNLDAAMRELRGLGRVASESESGEDVTQQHADLDQRLKTARDTEERLRSVLQQRTGSVSDVLQVEEEIARVRGDIESMEAEQTNLEHRVDFASIDLSVTVDYGPVSGSAPLSVRVRNAFVAGYRNAIGTVVGISLFVVAYGLTILIWIAILGVPVVLLRRRYRRMRAKL
jgi:anti-sigma factor RsiW